MLNHRRTLQATPSVAIGHIYVMHAMQSNIRLSSPSQISQAALTWQHGAGTLRRTDGFWWNFMSRHVFLIVKVQLTNWMTWPQKRHKSHTLQFSFSVCSGRESLQITGTGSLLWMYWLSSSVLTGWISGHFQHPTLTKKCCKLLDIKKMDTLFI